MKKTLLSKFNISSLKEYLFYKKMHGRKSKKIPDDIFLKTIYKHKFNHELDLQSPTTFNEKMQWLKLNDRNPFYTLLSDKIESKNIVAKEFGEKYVVPNIGVWQNAKEIDFNSLPNRFVLKCNHDSGSVIVCRNKENLDKKEAIKKLNNSLKKDYYLQAREWPYKDIKRKIFCEEYLETDELGLIDYKFFCFNGVPKFLYVSQGLENHKTARIGFFDLNGKALYFKRSDFKQLETFDIPSNFDEMKNLASKLAKFSESKFIRVDLYSNNNKIYFSEFTFFPCGGFIPFEPASADEEIGKLLNLN